MEADANSDDPMLDENESDESMDEDDYDDNIEMDSRELQQALLDEENNGTSLSEIKELWDSSRPHISSAEEGVSLSTTYIYLLRRLGADVNELKAAFLEGREILKSLFKENWDNNARFRRNFAYFLYSKAKEPKEALAVWKEILKSGWDSNAYMWIEAVRLERHFGDVETARALLYQGINARLSKPYDFFEYFLQFEREEGTRKQIDAALKKINAAAAKESRAKSRPNNKEREKPSNKKLNDKGQKRKADTQPESEEFRKVVKVSDDFRADKNGNASKSKQVIKDADGFAIPTLPAKSNKQDMMDAKPTVECAASSKVVETENAYLDNTEKTIFLSNIPFFWTRDNVEKTFPAAIDVRIPHKKKGSNKGFAFVDFATVEDATNALKLGGKLQVDGRNIQIFPNKNHTDESKPDFQFSSGQEKNKLFVRNVDFKSTTAELHNFFEQYGEIKDVRIVYHKNAKPKGVAYIEFNDEDGARKGLAANQQNFNGRQLEVHISDPSLAKKKSSSEDKKDPMTESALGASLAKMKTGFSLKPRVLLNK